MNNTVKTVLILSVSLLFGSVINAQGVSGLRDSVAVAKAKTEAKAEVKAKGEAKSEAKGEVKAKVKTQAGANGNGAVKQVRSARPDMSKARGARPGSVVRPSGSRIPKGVGRPRGAGHPVKR
jgi:hypothetical protein